MRTQSEEFIKKTLKNIKFIEVVNELFDKIRVLVMASRTQTFCVYKTNGCLELSLSHIITPR